MKKVFFISFVFLFLSFEILASTVIKGRVIDARSGTPLEFVNVALYQLGSSVPSVGLTTDAKGNFEISSISSGKYILKISMVGYQAYDKEVDIRSNILELGVIRLEEESKVLNEVVVVAQGSQMKFDIDKKVFSVDQNIASSGGSATDVLQNIPSVEVDNEGNVSLRNDANVEVWINGKPSGLTVENRAQVLQQMPAESIESIEIITNPSAKFNPEGTAGIINLVLKKNRRGGYYGSLSAGVMYPDGAKLGSNGGINLNYSSSKIDGYVNMGYRSMNMKGGGWNNRYNYLENDTTLLKQNNSSENNFDGVFMRAGLDWHLNDNNTFGISGFGMTHNEDGNNNINYGLYDVDNFLLKNYSRYNLDNGNHPSFHLNVDYQHEFGRKDNNIMASISYSKHNRKSDDQYIQRDYLLDLTSSDITQTTDNRNHQWEFKIDYSNKITENSRLEAGWQSNLQERNNLTSAIDNLNNGVEIFSYSDNFDYKEQIHAAYLTYGNKFDQLSLQAGLRGEYLEKKINNLETQSYFELFPSFYLSYSLPEQNELQLSYTRRINRPRGRMINPFRDYSDSTSISYGNPQLLPEFASSLELNYLKTWNQHSLSASAYYRFTDNVIENVRYMNGQTMESTYFNITKSKNAGLELVAKNNLFKILSLTSSLNLYYSQLDSASFTSPYNTTVTIPNQDDFSWSGRLLANLMLSKNTSAQITGRYLSPRIISQGERAANYSLDLGFRQTFFDRKLNLNLMVRDLLNSRKWKSTTWGTDFYQVSESYFHGRMVGMTLSYNFGNMKPKQTVKKRAESESPLNMEMENIE
ncbi:MAG TPA: TonB-dependent receptor [Paludibacteraceae bacterium]|nr:TonB-dependent receptor [Paludibacteraceae bacterium]HQF10780.1 TonB-dependent receptor [Paludibacteraceae bacterium]